MNYLIAVLVAVKAVNLSTSNRPQNCNPAQLLIDDKFCFNEEGYLPCHPNIKLGDNLSNYELLGLRKDDGPDSYTCGQVADCQACKVGCGVPCTNSLHLAFDNLSNCDKDLPACLDNKCYNNCNIECETCVIKCGDKIDGCQPYECCKDFFDDCTLTPPYPHPGKEPTATTPILGNKLPIQPPGAPSLLNSASPFPSIYE